MSTHIFVVQVECDSGEEYEKAISALTAVGEILSEE